MGERKNIVPLVSFDCFDQVPFGVLEMNFNPMNATGRLVNGCVCRG